MIDETTFWVFLGLSWVLMITIGAIFLRRNNQLLRRNAELELALADVLIKADVEKLLHKANNSS